jgi:hypothetical protein
MIVSGFRITRQVGATRPRASKSRQRLPEGPDERGLRVWLQGR